MNNYRQIRSNLQINDCFHERTFCGGRDVATLRTASKLSFQTNVMLKLWGRKNL